MPTIAIGGTKLHYHDVGSGPPTICLVHGSGGTGAVWMRQMEGLADVARVVAPDLPGHGESSGDGLDGIEHGATVVRALLDALDVRTVVIGGHSMGGGVAQAFALAYPDRVAGLILVGTGARLRVLPEVFERLERDYEAGVRYLTRMAVADAAPSELVDSLAAQAARTAPSVHARDFRACNAFDVLARIGAIRVPTLAIVGSEDRLTPPKYARFFEEHIAGTRLVVVDGAGHYVQVEQPDATTGAIREFLATLPRST